MIIENSFDVDADPDRVFEFLQNPHNVATCFPGAELTEDLGDDQYKGKVKIKLGPVTAAFAGIARITEKDDVARIAVLVAEGKDARGSGTAKATATMRVAPTETGSSVLLKTDLTISGKLAQFGRGIMADVSTRMVNDLAKRVRERIESEADAAAAPDTATAGAPADASAAPSSASAGTAASADAGTETGTAAGAGNGTATSTEATSAADAVADTGAVAASGDGATSRAGAANEAAASAADPATNSGAVSGATADTATNTAPETATAPPAAAASAKPPARPSQPEEPAGAIKASTLLKVMVGGMFRRLFARLRGRGAETRDS
ncbi:MAG: SRPBCC family protein [Actinoallomurus sp.]